MNFGLEANVLPVSSQDYAAFAAPSQDIPGTNKSKQKANKMRSFAVPDQYKEDKSTNADNLRRLNIFLAVVGSDGMVWLFVDHVRLIRFHVVSRGSPWTAQDLEPQSPVSPLSCNNMLPISYNLGSIRSGGTLGTASTVLTGSLIK